jgi:diacylglycerol kinase (ATP)
MRFLALANPFAAAGRARRVLPELTRRFAGTPHLVSGSVAPSAGDMRSRIRAARADGYDAVILLGGDGTLHEALPAIRDAGLPFVLIPCGRGDDFARNLGFGWRNWRNWDMRSEPLRREIDLPSINGVPFGSIACAGFDATVNRLARRHPRLFQGRIGYAACVLTALRSVRAFPATIRTDDAQWTGRVLMIAVANGPCYGGGMRIAPMAAMDDGRLDVCVVEELPVHVLLSQFPRVYRGTHLSHPKVHFLAGRIVEVTAQEEQDVYADGEYAGTLPATCAIGARRACVLSFPQRGERGTLPPGETGRALNGGRQAAMENRRSGT